MTRSEASSEHEEFLDDQASSCSYSSGWERSSSSDLLYMTDVEDHPDDFCAVGEFYTPPRSTGAVKVFDMEYKCELVRLPVPWSKPRPAPEPKEESEDSEEEQVKAAEAKNPWAKVEPAAVPVDPWAFLEPPKEVVRRAPPRERERERKPAPPSTRIDNSNTNKLCKHKNDCRMNRHNNCNMVHSLQEWRPRVCRFNNSCKRKTACGYYHTNTPVKEYLRVMIGIPDTIYAKNAQYYSKYL